MRTHENTEQLKNLLHTANNIAIFGHRNVDGDAIGSCLGLGSLLEDLGKKVSYWTTEAIGSSFDFVPHIEKFQVNFDYHPHYDLLIFCDTANPEQLLHKFRVGHEEYFNKMNTLVIDHHWSNTKYGDTNFVDSTSSSACEYIAELTHQIYPDQITPEVATYFFLGLSTDTGHFSYEQDSQRTFEIATYLLQKGANKKLIMDELYRSVSLKATKFVGTLINRIKKKNNVMYTYYHQHELDENNIDKESADNILSTLTSVDHSGIFALVKFNLNDPTPYLKASLRSKGNINVSEIAAKFGGGGHKAAAGLKHVISEDRESELEKFIGEL